MDFGSIDINKAILFTGICFRVDMYIDRTFDDIKQFIIFMPMQGKFSDLLYGNF